ncbi:MAG: aldo/keto reductase [Bowdeniella nasicola]|nr:aldo/keto reductase [Bowdeniella nasicola]
MSHRRVGASGLVLPAVSLGLWWNFGDDRPLQIQRDIIRRAFDLGMFHFDLANNYGPPAGSAEKNFGRIFDEDLRRHRNELIISTKAGWDMFPGPHGFGGSAKYLMGSLENSLRSLRMDYVDIFYSHRPDPDTPLEETCRALDRIVRSGKARYVGISSYSADQTRRAQAIMRELGTPLVIHQPSYSILNRWVEEPGDDDVSLLEACTEQDMGVIAFSPLAQGMLTDKYLVDDPASRLDSSRAGVSLREDMLKPETLEHVRALNDMARERGQSLAQMAIAWVLRDQGAASVTSALVGASSVAQLEDNLAATKNLDFTGEELDAIDRHAVDAGINIWWDATRSTAGRE